MDKNLGRQIEFDYLKGIFMPFIFLVHAFQSTGSAESIPVSVIYIVATMSGAAVFIFVQGFGIAYSQHSTPRDLTGRGLRLVAYQYLSNLFYVFALVIPYLIMKNSLSEAETEGFFSYVSIYSQFINIFFISGIIYLILALLERLHTPTIAYIVLAVITAILAPIVYGVEIDIPIIGYLLSLLIGEAPFVSFTPLYFLAYALLGVAAGRLYRRVEDKMKFYKRLLPVSIAIILLWWITVYIRFGYFPNDQGVVTDIYSLESVMDYAYSCPDIWHVIASVAHILFYSAIIYFITEKFRPGIVSSQLLYYSRHITKYYAIHLAVYLFAFGIHGYVGFSSLVCYALTVMCMCITEIIVRAYNRYYPIVKKCLT